MVKYDLQFFGGRGSAGGNKATSNDDVLKRFRALNEEYEKLDNMSDEEIEKMGEEKWEARRELLGGNIDYMADKYPELEKEYMEKVAEPYRAEKNKATPESSAKVSSGGVLPENIVASSEKEAIELFNRVNSPSKGSGYRIKSLGYKGYELVRTRDGKDVSKNIERRKRVSLHRNKDGTYRFYD